MQDKQQPKNWDKILTDFDKEDGTEGQAADSLDALFKQIYGGGDDDTRRAMMKSFVESGGTALSTSWKEVSKKKMKVKAPDGCEYRKWD